MSGDPVRTVFEALRFAAGTADGGLLLAVSGGLDSSVLMDGMLEVGEGRVVAIATFDHGTGVAAETAVRQVAERAAAAGVTFLTARLDAGGQHREGREAGWRAARYAFLRGQAQALGARVVTAHTEDDQVETVLFRVMRGSGARGLAGLYAPSDTLRPLLSVRREVLSAYASERGLTWMEDPSNRAREFARNRLRLDLLPALRATDPDFERSILTVARRAAALRADVERFVTRHLRPAVERGERLLVASRELRGYDRDSIETLWVALAGRVGLALDRRGTRRIAAFTMMDPGAGRIPLAGGWCLEATRDAYILERVAGEPGPAVELPLAGSVEWGRFRFRVEYAPGDSGDDEWAWRAAVGAPGRVFVRCWDAGDRLEPSRGQPRRRVTRYLSDVGLRGRERAGWPVVVAGEDVVWIPGVRRSDAATDRSGRPVRHYVCERIDR